jgi:hypothetical protein
MLMLEILKTKLQFIPSQSEAKNYPIIGFVDPIHRTYLKILSNTAIRRRISFINIGTKISSTKTKRGYQFIHTSLKTEKEAMKNLHNHIFI